MAFGRIFISAKSGSEMFEIYFEKRPSSSKIGAIFINEPKDSVYVCSDKPNNLSKEGIYIIVNDITLQKMNGGIFREELNPYMNISGGYKVYNNTVTKIPVYVNVTGNNTFERRDMQETAIEREKKKNIADTIPISEIEYYYAVEFLHSSFRIKKRMNSDIYPNLPVGAAINNCYYMDIIPVNLEQTIVITSEYIRMFHVNGIKIWELKRRTAKAKLHKNVLYVTDLEHNSIIKVNIKNGTVEKEHIIDSENIKKDIDILSDRICVANYVLDLNLNVIFQYSDEVKSGFLIESGNNIYSISTWGNTSIKINNVSTGKTHSKTQIPLMYSVNYQMISAKKIYEDDRIVTFFLWDSIISISKENNMMNPSVLYKKIYFSNKDVRASNDDSFKYRNTRYTDERIKEFNIIDLKRVPCYTDIPNIGDSAIFNTDGKLIEKNNKTYETVSHENKQSLFKDDNYTVLAYGYNNGFEAILTDDFKIITKSRS